MHIKLIKKNNEGFTPDAIKRFTVDDPNYVDHIIIPDKKNGDDVIVKIVRGTKEHPLFSGTMYYGRALRSSATEPFSTGMGSLKLMADWLDNLAKQDPEESLADLDAIEQRAKSEKREGATGSVEIKEGPQEGDLIYTPAAQSVAEKLGDDLLMAILAAASDEAWSQADEYEWKDAVDTDHDLEWNTCQALGWGFDDMGEDAPFKGDSGKVYSGDEAKNAYNAIAALDDDDRYSLFFNNQPRNYSHIRDVVATAMDMAADDEGEDESKRNEDKRDLEAIRAKFCDNPDLAKIGRLAEPYEGDAVFGTQTWSDGVPVTKYWHRDNRSQWVSLKKGTRCIALLDRDGEEVEAVWIPYRNGWLRVDGSDIEVNFN